MGSPLFKVTLSNDIEGSLVISEPGGWDEAKLTLERNKVYHSIDEIYDQPLTFYGENTEENGGIQYVRNIEQTQGPDAQIGILIEVSHDEGDTYETLVDNILSIDTVKEIDFYKLDMGMLNTSFWQKFINRKDTPIDLASAVDLDGEARTVINPVTIQLPTQKIRALHVSSSSYGIGYTGITTGDYVWRSFDNITVSEIKEVFTIPNSPLTIANSIPVWIVEANEAGDYTFDIRHECALYTPPSTFDPITNEISFYIQKNDDTPIAFTQNDFADYSEFVYINTLTFVVGDIIRVYGIFGSEAWEGGGKRLTIFGDALSDSVFLPAPSGNTNPTYFNVTADTTYTDTDTEGFLIHEAGNSITDRIIGRNGTFYSEYLGNQNTQIQSYAEDGCGSNYGLARGLNIRGYSLADKPFFMSFQTYWEGINPLLNLGLAIEIIDDLPMIRVEEKEYFYNPITSVDFDWVNNIERSYDLDSIFKAIEIGFEKWSAESASGVDDPQSKRVYNTRFKTIGKEIKILSKFIGASLAIEQTRRNRVEQGKDWRLDEDVMIIAINPDGSPEYQPELDENFSSITGLLNADTRYNIRLSVARNFERWKNYFNGCLQWYVNDSPEEEYKFASGEGNFDMVTTIDENDCEGSGSSPEPSLSEKQNIAVTDDFLFMPIVYTFEHPLTWDEYKTIRDNKNNAIGISRTDSGHRACFIQTLEYEITHGKAKFVVLLGENNPL